MEFEDLMASRNLEEMKEEVCRMQARTSFGDARFASSLC